jgi:hypothetical protein
MRKKLYIPHYVAVVGEKKTFNSIYRRALIVGNEKKGNVKCNEVSR